MKKLTAHDIECAALTLANMANESTNHEHIQKWLRLLIKTSAIEAIEELSMAWQEPLDQ